jgi:ABC-type nitrate/sulfonate/bicarbonate transport system substrate-binding protein
MKGYIEKNSGVIERFARAHGKGVDWVNNNRGSKELEDIIASFTRIPPPRDWWSLASGRSSNSFHRAALIGGVRKAWPADGSS